MSTRDDVYFQWQGTRGLETTLEDDLRHPTGEFYHGKDPENSERPFLVILLG